MKLTVIGCQGAYPGKNQATSGYLLEYGALKILLDCGSGVLSLLQNYIGLPELDAVVLSHYHADHCADVRCLQYAAMIDIQTGRRERPLEIWGPGEAERLSWQAYCTGRSYLDIPGFSIGALRLTVHANVHEIPSYAVRIEDADGRSLVYSGDTGYYGELAEFARDASVFLCESSLYAAQRSRVEGHLCADEAGLLARDANAGLLCLTHLPHYGRPAQLAEEAGEFYSRRILLARPGLRLSVG